jgi:hypothetical protein
MDDKKFQEGFIYGYMTGMFGTLTLLVVIQVIISVSFLLSA